jgi:hypothetical protein
VTVERLHCTRCGEPVELELVPAYDVTPKHRHDVLDAMQRMTGRYPFSVARFRKWRPRQSVGLGSELFLGDHFAFRMGPDGIDGGCRRCGEPLSAAVHTHLALEEDSWDDSLCTLAPKNTVSRRQAATARLQQGADRTRGRHANRRR